MTWLSRNLVSALRVLSTFNFLESAFYGMDAIAHSRPPRLPLVGARGGFSVCGVGGGDWGVSRLRNRHL